MTTATGAKYSKGQVNRAGAAWARFAAALNAEAANPWAECSPEVLEEAAGVIDWWRAEHAYPLRMVAANLRYYVPPLADGRVPVTQRLKRFSTVVDKLLREPTMALTQMADVGGARAILPDRAAVQAVSRRLRKNWDVPKTRDYVAEPKASGYRAVHHVVRRKGQLIEVQLRTPLQDLWANTVEEDSRRLRVGYKSGSGAEAVHAYYAAMSELFALRESGREADDDFARRIRLLQAEALPHLEQARRDRS